MAISCFVDNTIILSDHCKQLLLNKGIQYSSFQDFSIDLSSIDNLLLHSRLSDDLLRQMINCKYIGIRAHNIDYINVDLAKKMGIEVRGLQKQHGVNAVAEHTVALIFALAKNLLPAHQNISEGKWRKNLTFNVELKGKTVGIIGNGQIGQRVAEICKLLGMKTIIAGKPNETKNGELLIDQVLAEADIITLHLSPHPQNKNYFDNQKISKLKEGAILINTARGSVLDYNALLNQLENGRDLRVGLDVFPEEPYLENQFSTFNNVLLTPHLAYYTAECINNMNDELLENLLEFTTKMAR